MSNSMKNLMMVTVALIGLAGTAEAGYSTNGAVVTNNNIGNGINNPATGNISGYQTNSNYAQALAAQTSNQSGSQTGTQASSSVYTGSTGVQANGVQGQTMPNSGMSGQGTGNGMSSNGSMSSNGGMSSQGMSGNSMPGGMRASTVGMSRSGMLSDPQQIRQCLCLQTQYEMQQNDVSSKQAAYSQAMSQRASLDSQLTAAKSAGQTPAQLDQIRQASAQRIQLQNVINQQYIPALQDATGRYDSTVASYQQSCGGKSYDTDVLSRVKTGLVCQGG